MRRLATTTICLIIIFFNSFAQNQHAADSLKLALNEGDLNHAQRLEALSGLIFYLSNPDEIRYYSDLLDTENSEDKIPKYSIQAMYHLGYSYRLTGQPEKAIYYCFKAVKIAKEHHLKKEEALCYSEISTAYLLNNDYKNALLYNNNAIYLFRELNASDELALTLLNTGFNYYSYGILDSALLYYDEAEVLFDSLNLEIGTAYTLGNRALVFWKQGNYITAIPYIKQAINQLSILGDDYGIADYSNQLGKIYHELEIRDSALFFTEKGLEIATTLDLKEQVRDASLLLHELYKKEENYETALQFYTQYQAYKDSIQDQETTKKLADQRIAFEVGQKQIELDLISSEKRNQQIILIALAIILIIILVFALVVFKNYKEKNLINLQLAQQKTELEALNTTKDKFFSIISHDLRGPVSSFFGIARILKYYVNAQKPETLLELADDITSTTESLKSLLDNLLSWAMQQQQGMPFHPVVISIKETAKEVQQILQNNAHGKQVKIHIEGNQNVKINADKNMLETIIRNLTSNAIKFTPNGGEVFIVIDKSADNAILKIKDTGIGMTSDQQQNLFTLNDKKSTRGTEGEKGLGLGLQLVYDFVLKNNGSITVESEVNRGTSFTIRFPLIH